MVNVTNYSKAKNRLEEFRINFTVAEQVYQL